MGFALAIAVMVAAAGAGESGRELSIELRLADGASLGVSLVDGDFGAADFDGALEFHGTVTPADGCCPYDVELVTSVESIAAEAEHWGLLWREPWMAFNLDRHLFVHFPAAFIGGDVRIDGDARFDIEVGGTEGAIGGGVIRGTFEDLAAHWDMAGANRIQLSAYITVALMSELGEDRKADERGGADPPLLAEARAAAESACRGVCDDGAERVCVERLRYDAALEVQRAAHAEVLAGDRAPTVFFVEHEPVITISRRQGATRHLQADEATLGRLGVEVCRTDRGGDITLHAPGQLVAYPIIPLNEFGLNIRRYVRLLEGVVIRAVERFGVRGERDDCATGVWVDGAKLAAIGVRVQRWVTLHGLALNVTTDLSLFDLLVPCGLRRPVTSLRRVLGDGCPDMAGVRAALRDAFGASLGA